MSANAATRSRYQKGAHQRQVRALGLQHLSLAETALQAIGDRTLESVTVGSTLTGSPGQPVRSGRLRSSWTITREPRVVLIATPIPWAIEIEEGITRAGQPYIQHSRVGGSHSVAMTVLGMGRIAQAIAAEVRG